MEGLEIKVETHVSKGLLPALRSNKFGTHNPGKFFRLVAQLFTDVQPRTEQPCANSAEGQSGAAVIRSLRVQPRGTVLLGRLHVCGGIRGTPRNAG